MPVAVSYAAAAGVRRRDAGHLDRSATDVLVRADPDRATSMLLRFARWRQYTMAAVAGRRLPKKPRSAPLQARSRHAKCDSPAAGPCRAAANKGEHCPTSLGAVWERAILSGRLLEVFCLILRCLNEFGHVIYRLIEREAGDSCVRPRHRAANRVLTDL